MDYSDDAFHTFMDLDSHQADHVLDSVLGYYMRRF